MRIAIIGCGPAGLFAASALHDNHFDVSLFEKFTEPAPVGSGLVLQPTGLAMLEAIGLRAKAESLGQRIDRMSGKLAPDGKTVLDIQYRALAEDLYGVAIHRSALFHILYDAVTTRRIPIETNCHVLRTEVLQNQALRLVTKNNAAYSTEFDLVIDASGANSSVLQATFPQLSKSDLSFGALWTTVLLHSFLPTTLEQRYVGARKMIGVLPCGTLAEPAHMPNHQEESGENQLATLFYSIEGKNLNQWRESGLHVWKKEMTTLWPETEPLVAQITDINQLTYAAYSHHTLKPPYKDGVVFIGDTAHATSPQLGQGANMALLDGLALAIALTENRTNLQQALKRYTRLRRAHVSTYQTVSYLLTPFYQSNSSLLPFLRDTFFEPVTSIGFMNRFITRLGAGMLGNPATALVSQFNKSKGHQ